MTTRAAITARISTDGQEDGTSIQSQLEACRAYCEQHGYEVVMEEAETGSAYDLDRPGLLRILEAMRAGRVEVIVALALDRLSRKQTHVAILADEFESLGCRMEFVTETFEDGATGTFLRSAKAFAAELEREKIRFRTMQGKATLVQQGHAPTWSCNLFGFTTFRPTKEQRALGQKAHRVVVESEATVVKECFALIIEGHSRQAVADLLNERGVPSPGTTRMTYDDGRQARWQSSSIQQLIQNPAYRGDTVVNRFTRRPTRNAYTGRINKKRQVVRPESEWTLVGGRGELTPAIVSVEDWQLANQRLSANTGSRTRNEQYPMLLRGVVSCSNGHRMYADNAARPGRRNFYRCRDCRVAIGQEDADAWVWESVQEVLFDRARVTAEIRRRLEAVSETHLQVEAKRLTEAVGRVERQQAGLRRRFTENPDMPWSLIQSEHERLEQEHADLTKALSGIRERLGREFVELDRLGEVARKLGPRLAAPTFEVKTRVIAELGLTVKASRLYQLVEWQLAEDTGSDIVIDLTGVSAREPDEGDGGCTADRLSASPAGSRRSRSTSTSTASSTAGATSARRRPSRR